MIPALLAGLIGGGVIGWAMLRSGMLAERSGLAVLLAAIAFFYPVFAVQAQAAWPIIALHALVFAAFALLALIGFARGTRILALGLIGHGLFDMLTLATGHPGPPWWPTFCATLDLMAGGIVLALLHRKAISQ